jgi:hypothetical protein
LIRYNQAIRDGRSVATLRPSGSAGTASKHLRLWPCPAGPIKVGATMPDSHVHSAFRDLFQTPEMQAAGARLKDGLQSPELQAKLKQAADGLALLKEFAGAEDAHEAIYLLAGEVGVDPSRMTARDLMTMAIGRRLAEVRQATLTATAVAAGTPAASAAPQYVTLSDIRTFLRVSKSKTKRWKTRPINPMPPPDVHGGAGKADEWVWSKIRPWLETETDRKLPERFPSQFPPN